MRGIVAICVLLAAVVGSQAETTEGFQKMIRPVAVACRETEKAATDDDLETVVHLKKDFTPEAKCLAACVMDKIGMMKDGVLRSEEEILVPYKVVFADDAQRLADAPKVIHKCREEAFKKFPKETCNMAHSAVICTILNTE